MDKVYQDLLKRINSLEAENCKYEEKIVTIEESYRKRIEEMNKAFSGENALMQTLNIDNNNLNKTTATWNT
jgi:hypothetical protein